MELRHFWNFYCKYNPAKSLWLAPGVNEVLVQSLINYVAHDAWSMWCDPVLVMVRALLLVKMVVGLSPLSPWFSICTARCARQCELGQPSKPSSAQGCDLEMAQGTWPVNIPWDAPADSSVEEATRMCCGSFYGCAVVHSKAVPSDIVFSRLGGQQWHPVSFLSLKEETFDCQKTCSS